MIGGEWLMFRKKEKKKWRFFWKNFAMGGRLIRLLAAGALFAVANTMKEDDELKAAVLAVWGGAFLFDALARWSPYRAILRWPTRKARLRHYPE